jgi:RHS repeat-associated protein
VPKIQRWRAVFGPALRCESFVIQERDTNNTPTVSYTRGTDLSGSIECAGGIGGLLARSSGYSSGNWTSHAFYHADANGNVTYLIDSSQAMQASYRYDPFGNLISSSGSLASANVYRFSSKEIHVNSGMYYYLYRFYDPNLQRWINRDPIEESGGINLYVFVGNNPVCWRDTFGQAIADLPPPPKPTPHYPNPVAGNPSGPHTISCQGGKYVVNLKKDPQPSAIRSICDREHEDQHIADWKERYSENSCQGVPDGQLPGGRGDPAFDQFLTMSECNAHKVSRDCYKRALPCTAPGSISYYNTKGAINADQAYLDDPKHQCPK